MKKIAFNINIIIIMALLYSCGKSDPTKLLEKIEKNIAGQVPGNNSNGGAKPDPCLSTFEQVVVMDFHLSQLPIKGAMGEDFFQSTPRGQTLNGEKIDENIGWNLIVSWDENNALLGIHDYQENVDDQFFKINGNKLQVKNVLALEKISPRIIEEFLKKETGYRLCNESGDSSIIFSRNKDQIDIKWVKTLQLVADSRVETENPLSSK